EWISGDSWLIDVSVDGTDDAVLRSDAGTLSTVLATGDAMPDSADTFDNLRLLGRGGGSTYVSASRPLGVESLWAIADGAAPVRLLTEGQAVSFVGDPAGTPASTISSIALQAVRPDGDLTVQLLFTDGSQGVFLLDAPGGGFPAGDYNRDGVVTQADYAVWAAEFGTAASNADGNEDGAINAADYTVWRAAFQTAAATPAPEPTTAATVAATPLAWTRGRRRR
ncbi:MAG: dockerin type I domain-containing protein, partial [Planctomycetota bacterium]